MRSLPCSGTSVQQHRFFVLVASSSCNQKLAGEKKQNTKRRAAKRGCSVIGFFPRQACGVIIIISGHLSGQVMRRMCPERSAKHKS